MNLNALEQDLYRRFGFNTASPDTATQTRLRAYLNETQQEILSEPGMDTLLNDAITFASVASISEYSLPPSIARIKPPIQDRTNLIPLWPISQDEWRNRYPSPTAVTGTPGNYVDLGFAGVSQQPADASELFVKSTDNATDTGAGKKAYIEGYVTGGYYKAATVALTGTTAVTFGAAVTSWISIEKFYLDFTPVGQVILQEDSGAGTELARIGIGQQYARYRRIALAICPASAITYTVDYERDVQDMAQATDEPLLPLRFHRLLGLGARMKEYEKQDQDRYVIAKTEYEKALKKLKFWLFSQTGDTPNLRGAMRSVRPSQLGGYFPSGT